jgi:LL-H family phage holin
LKIKGLKKIDSEVVDMDWTVILNDVVNAVVGLVAALIVAAFIKLRQKVNSYIDSHTTAAQRELLNSVAAEAVAYAGTVFKEQNGEQRLEIALSYVNTHLKPCGISFTDTELRGVVEKAYAAYKAQGQSDIQKVADAVAQSLQNQKH